MNLEEQLASAQEKLSAARAAYQSSGAELTRQYAAREQIRLAREEVKRLDALLDPDPEIEKELMALRGLTGAAWRAAGHRLINQHGVDLLVRTARRIERVRPDLKPVLTGPGSR